VADHNGAVVTEVTLRQEDVSTPRFTPRELRLIKAQYGQSFMQLITDEGTDDKFVVVAWLKLRRDGFELSFEDMDDVLITIEGELAADPTIAPLAPPDTTSPRSAGTTE
jgi:hypothetical protein